MSGWGFALGAGLGLADSIFDFSGNQERAQQSLDMSADQFRKTHGLAKDQWEQQKRWYERNYRDSRTVIADTVKQAQEAGIGPLAALGKGGASPPSIPTGAIGASGSVPQAYRDPLGQNLAQIGQMYLDYELRKEQLMSAKLQNVQKAGEIGQPTVVVGKVPKDPYQQPPSWIPPGPSTAMWETVYDEQGKEWKVPGQQFEEMELPKAAMMLYKNFRDYFESLDLIGQDAERFWTGFVNRNFNNSYQE